MVRKHSAGYGAARQTVRLAILSLIAVVLLISRPARADILFQNQTSGQLVDWLLDGVTMVKYVFPLTPGTPVWKVVGSGDFSGDGKPDLLFQNQQTGQLIFWQMNGPTFIQWYYINPSLPGPIEWQVSAVGDFDGDSKPDIVFQNRVTGQLVYWLMNGANLKNYGYLPDPGSPNWKVVAAADINRDGKTDLLFQNQQTGSIVYWLLDRVALITFGFLPEPGTATWQVVGMDDFNSDGNADVLFQNQQTGKLVYWLLNGAAVINIDFIKPSDPGSLDWKVATLWAGQSGGASGTIQ